MKKVLLVLTILTICFQNAISQIKRNSLHFEHNDYVNLDAIAEDISNLNEFTVEFWVKFNGQYNTDYNTFYAVNASDYSNRFLIRFAGPIDGISDAAVIYINDGSNQYIIGSRPIGDNKCHHIAFTYNNGVCALYVDGQLDGSGNYTFDFKTTDLHSMGQEYDMTSNPTSAFYNGELDDFRIWNTAKLQADIDSNKNIELNGNEIGLLTSFDFNQGVPSSKNDTISSLNNLVQLSHNGELVGFDLNGSTSNFIKSVCSDTLVNITESEILSQIDIYPNPTNGFLNLTNTQNVSSIVIRNSLGQVILKPESSSLINISSLSKAIYFIEISTHENRKQVLRILKL